MIEYLVALGIVLVGFLVARCVVRPKKEYQRYVRAIENMGYKVHALPFAPFRVPFLEMLEKGTKEGDSLKFWKEVSPNIDVIVGNSMNSIALEIIHPDFIKDFYSNEHLYNYPKSKMLTAPIERAQGKGIPFSEGEEWKRRRRIINQVFNFDFIKSMTGKISQLCSKAITETEQASSQTSQNGQRIVEFEVVDLTVKMFSSVVLECFLGGALEEQIEGKPICIFMNELSSDVAKQAMKPSTFLLGAKQLNWGLTEFDRDVNRRLAIFRKWGLSYIQKKVQQSKKRLQSQPNQNPQDIIQALIRSYTISPKNQNFYSNEQIFEQFSTFFIVGTDTTSHYVMMMIYFIAQNLQIQEKVRRQIGEYMAGEDYSYENLKNFRYIEWVQKETTRYYGPVNSLLLRVAKEDNILNGLEVRKGTLLTIQNLGNHYSQKYFKNPLEFRPQRWQKQCDNLPPFVLGGFSAGPRTCIGKHLVSIQSKIGLIKFLKRYKKITLPSSKIPIKMQWKFVYSPEYFPSKMTINQPKSPSQQF